MVRGQDVTPGLGFGATPGISDPGFGATPGISDPGFGAAPGMSDHDGLADVAAMEAEFPEFAIWQECAGGRVQYIARRMRRGVHPHTIVTSDPAELRACLITRGL